MKRVFILFIFAFLLVPSNSFAAGYNGDVFIYPTLKVNINGIQDISGESGKFSNGDKLVPKVMSFKGTTYVPIRYFSNLLEINDIGWDGESKTIWVNSEKPKDVDLKERYKIVL